MALFRFHRGGLKESLATTIIVKTNCELMKVISDSIIEWPNTNKDFSICCSPYPAENNFDSRIGWYTHMVVANIYESHEFHPIGFLSEPLYE